MTPSDVVAAAVVHGIPDSRLLLFAELAASNAPPTQLTSVLSAYRPSEVLTGAAVLVADDRGVTMSSLDGQSSSTVSWPTLSRHLAAVMTPGRAEALAGAYRAANTPQAAPTDELRRARSLLAYDVLNVAGLVPATLLSSHTAVGVVLDGTSGDGGFAGLVALAATGPQSVACVVNGADVVELGAHTEVHRVVVHVPGVFDDTVRHVPPGDSVGVLPPTFAQRIAVDVLDEDASGARWTLQVDQFDVAIVEAANSVPPTVRVAVYDNDPTVPFLRCEATRTVPPVPAAVTAPDRVTPQRPPRRSTGLGR